MTAVSSGPRLWAGFGLAVVDQFNGQPLGPIDDATRDQVAPLVGHAGLTMALNEAWLVLGALVVVSLAALPWLGRQRSPSNSTQSAGIRTR